MKQRTAVCVDCQKTFDSATTGRPSSRCTPCRAPRSKVQYLTCATCERLWVRQAQPRRPPMQCEACRPTLDLVDDPDLTGEKRCFTCKRLRPRSRFHRQKRRPDGLNASCMSCVNVASRILSCSRCSLSFKQQPAVGRRRPDRHALCLGCSKTHKWCSRCSVLKGAGEFSRAASKSGGRASHCLQCMSAKYHSQSTDRKLQASIRKFNLTVAQFKAMLTQQDGACAICRTIQAECQRGYLMVDHDHACCPGDKSCGACVRGLLCGPCNFAIGLLRDDPARMLRAAEYVRRDM